MFAVVAIGSPCLDKCDANYNVCWVGCKSNPSSDCNSKCLSEKLVCYLQCPDGASHIHNAVNVSAPTLPIQSDFNSYNDLSQFKIDINNPDEDWVTIENSNAHFKARVNGGGRGRAEIRASGAIYDDFQAESQRYFRVKFSAPSMSDGRTNQIGIFAQGIQEYADTSKPWDPIFFLLGWPGQGVQLSVYTSGRTTGGERHTVYPISYHDPRGGSTHVVEIWARFTTNGDGYYDVQYDYGGKRRIYSGPTLFIRDMKANFKVGTYAGIDGSYYSDVFVDELFVGSY